jgi:3-hydroxyanthranilic acid dioxygenase
MQPLIAFRLWQGIDEYRQAFEPPVGNKVISEDSQFIAMIIRGPHARRDFYVDPSDEIFYMLKGDMILESMHVADLEGELKAAIEPFDTRVGLRTCRPCGDVQPEQPPVPQPPYRAGSGPRRER